MTFTILGLRDIDLKNALDKAVEKDIVLLYCLHHESSKVSTGNMASEPQRITHCSYHRL